MKILMILDNLKLGGKERRCLELTKRLLIKYNLNIQMVILNDNVHYKEIHDLPIKVHFFKRKTKKDLSIVFKLFKICKSFRPDLIHSWGSMSSMYAIPVSLFLRIKLLNAMIAGAPVKLPLSERIRKILSLPFSEKILSNSYAGLKRYKIPESKGVVIHNGFDFNRVNNLMDPIILKTKLGIHAKHIIGMVGAIENRKDYKTYVEAAKMVLGKRNDVVFLIIGDGAKKEIYQRMASYHLNKGILFTGLTNEVESIVNLLTVGVLTSFSEGVSNSVLEYMALKKPVVATEVDGNKEIIDDGITGYLIKVGDSEQLANKLFYLLDNSKKCLSMGKEGYEKVKMKFEMSKISEEYYDLYNSIIKPD